MLNQDLPGVIQGPTMHPHHRGAYFYHPYQFSASHCRNTKIPKCNLQQHSPSLPTESTFTKRPSFTIDAILGLKKERTISPLSPKNKRDNVAFSNGYHHMYDPRVTSSIRIPHYPLSHPLVSRPRVVYQKRSPTSPVEEEHIRDLTSKSLDIWDICSQKASQSDLRPGGHTPVKENPFLVNGRSPKQRQHLVKGSKEISTRIEEPDWMKTGGSMKSKRIRTIFTQNQLDSLEQEFTRQQYMVGSERLYLASTLNLTESQVKVWFQNRRIKWRKQNFEKQQAKLAKIRALQKLRESDGETSNCSETEADDNEHQDN